MEWPEVYFGTAKELHLPELPDDPEPDPDDELLEVTPEDVVDMLGFDPLELLEESEKGGAGSGNRGHAGRPGQVGGSAPGSGGRARAVTTEAGGDKLSEPEITSYAKEAVHDLHTWMAGNSDREAAVVVFSDGRKEHFQGDGKSVQFLKGSLDKAVYVAHNHPNGSSFSGEDIALMANYHLKRMDVTCTDGTVFTVERTKKTTPNFEPDGPSFRIAHLWTETMESIKPVYMKRFLNGGEDGEKIWQEHTHEVMRRMAKHYGLKYEMKPGEAAKADDDMIIFRKVGQGTVLDDSEIAKHPYGERTEKHLPGQHDQQTHGGVGHGDIKKPAPFEEAGEAETLLSRLIADGGFTYHPVKNISPTDGFMVSRYKRREFVADVDKVSPNTLHEYMRKNQDLLVKADHYLGGWVDAGKAYLDISVRHESQEAALKLARKHRQLAIFNLAKFETIYTKPVAHA